MKLMLIRHGATPGNEAHRYTGRSTNESLSEAGRKQCAQAGQLPEVELVFASPLKRSQETARLCFPNAALQVVAGLEEYDFGVFEGRTAAEMVDDAAYRAWVDSGCITCCPGGESRDEFIARSNEALFGLMQAQQAAGREHAIVVAHGGTIMAAMHACAIDETGRRIDRSDMDYFNWNVPHAQGYTAQVRFTDAGPVLEHVEKFTALPTW